MLPEQEINVFDSFSLFFLFLVVLLLLFFFSLMFLCVCVFVCDYKYMKIIYMNCG